MDSDRLLNLVVKLTYVFIAPALGVYGAIYSIVNQYPRAAWAAWLIAPCVIYLVGTALKERQEYRPRYAVIWAKLVLAGAFIALLCVSMVTASRYQARCLERVGPGALLKECNFQGQDLSGSDLSGANLSAASLIDADLRQANLQDTNLASASLERADLQGAYLVGSNFTGARLRQANLQQADLAGADLSGADLTDANLQRANLTRAILSRAALTNTILVSATLTSADLSYASLAGADVTGAILDDAVLNGASLAGVRGLTLDMVQSFRSCEEVQLETLAIELGEAETSGLVQAHIYGQGLESMNVALVSMSNAPIEVTILPGTIFEASSTGTQDMVVIKEEVASLRSRGSRQSLDVAVACATMELDVPEEKDSFTIGQAASNENLAKLLSLPSFHSQTFRVQQFAIWTITDNPARNGYVGIGYGVGTGPDDDEMAAVRALFERAGIATEKYRGFRGNE